MKGHKELSKGKKYLLIVLGTISVILGVIGILLPILPTTPFLLVAAACYVRSSERMYNWLLYNRVFGRYLRNYILKRGMPMHAKVFTIGALWLAIMTTVYFTPLVPVKLILIFVAAGVTWHLVCIRTCSRAEYYADVKTKSTCKE